ncbi:MAG: mannonate dehydratase [Saprospiraceae bacterium]|nr:mannonate dehydratase [Saprospiraceae bacterium]
MSMLEQTWRWFGPNDPITLHDIRQVGATGIVSALHEIPNGMPWSKAAILERKHLIEAQGLRWSVIESIPVHEDIKRRCGNYQNYIENYKTSLQNAAECGIPVVCYNFMPVLDWTRTDLAYQVTDGSLALRFDMVEVAAFDIHILKRKNAIASYHSETIQRAAEWFQKSDEQKREKLIRNILAGLPGAEESYTVDSFRKHLDTYHEIDAQILQRNLVLFLKEIAPVAASCGIRLAIHPDDPPFPIFGLPRVVSTLEHAEVVIQAFDSEYNGLCFCTGSFGARKGNKLPDMVRKIRHRINFLHFRSVQLEADGSFYEADHLAGSAGMDEVLLEVVQEQQRRRKEGRLDLAIPFRPDHGHTMLGDLRSGSKMNPGYSLYGRMRGLAELRGLEIGIRRGLGII